MNSEPETKEEAPPVTLSPVQIAPENPPDLQAQVHHLASLVAELSAQVGELEEVNRKSLYDLGRHKRWLSDLTFDNTALQLALNDVAQNLLHVTDTGDVDYAHYKGRTMQLYDEHFARQEAEKAKPPPADMTSVGNNEPIPFGG